MICIIKCPVFQALQYYVKALNCDTQKSDWYQDKENCKMILEAVLDMISVFGKFAKHMEENEKKQRTFAAEVIIKKVESVVKKEYDLDKEMEELISKISYTSLQ